MSQFTTAVELSHPVPMAIDGDSHLQEPASWLLEIDGALARSCSGQALLLGTAAFACVDPREPPRTGFWRTLTAWARDRSMADVGDLVEQPETAPYYSSTAFDAEARIAWLDAAQIRHQVCNPTIAAHVALGAAQLSGPMGLKVTSAYNRWAQSAIGPHRTRLHPTTLIDVTIVDEALDELEAGARFGSATFLLPIDEVVWRRLAHPDARLFWDVVSRLSLMPTLHLGVASGHRLAGHGVPTAAAWADMQLRAQRCLLHWVSSPHAAEHPEIRVLVQELGVDWALPWLRNLQRACSTPVVEQLGVTATADRSMSEIAASQIVWVPLPRDPIEAVMRDAPSLQIAFGSDFPHHEGWGPEPVEAFRQRLGDRELTQRACSELSSAPSLR